MHTLNGKEISIQKHEALNAKAGHAGVVVDGETLILAQGAVTLDACMAYDLPEENENAVLIEVIAYRIDECYGLSSLQGFKFEDSPAISSHWFTSLADYREFIAAQIALHSVFNAHS